MHQSTAWLTCSEVGMTGFPKSVSVSLLRRIASLPLLCAVMLKHLFGVLRNPLLREGVVVPTVAPPVEAKIDRYLQMLAVLRGTEIMKSRR